MWGGWGFVGWGGGGGGGGGLEVNVKLSESVEGRTGIAPPIPKLDNRRK